MPSKIATRRSPIHGNGMFAVAPIRKGERLIEYKGKRRTHEDVDDESRNTFLHNEEVVGDLENTGDAREAADTLRRRSRILRLARPTRDQPESDD